MNLLDMGTEWKATSDAKDAQAKFVEDFVAGWTKVMDLDRYDLR